jgi:hypothetical protein
MSSYRNIETRGGKWISDYYGNSKGGFRGPGTIDFINIPYLYRIKV